MLAAVLPIAIAIRIATLEEELEQTTLSRRLSRNKVENYEGFLQRLNPEFATLYAHHSFLQLRYNYAKTKADLLPRRTRNFLRNREITGRSSRNFQEDFMENVANDIDDMKLELDFAKIDLDEATWRRNNYIDLMYEENLKLEDLNKKIERITEELVSLLMEKVEV
jgi:hypothetical protein